MPLEHFHELVGVGVGVSKIDRHSTFHLDSVYHDEQGHVEVVEVVVTHADRQEGLADDLYAAENVVEQMRLAGKEEKGLDEVVGVEAWRHEDLAQIGDHNSLDHTSQIYTLMH